MSKYFYEFYSYENRFVLTSDEKLNPQEVIKFLRKRNEPYEKFHKELDEASSEKQQDILRESFDNFMSTRQKLETALKRKFKMKSIKVTNSFFYDIYEE